MKVADNQSPSKENVKSSKPSSAQSAALQPKGKVIIHLHWPDVSNTDLDLWVRTDNPHNIVSFREKDVSNMWLDHDSQGAASNRVTMSDGTYKQAFGNDEVVEIKECTDTRVNVNIHNYRPADDLTEFPLATTVEVIIPPAYNKLITKSFTMGGVKGEEVTAFSFDLNENCEISNIDQTTFIPFVYQTLPNTTTVPPGLPSH
jgi:hypothetical protein